MRSELLDRSNGRRTFALVFAAGDAVCEPLLEFARESAVTGASMTGIGAFRSATLGFFDLEGKDYQRIEVDEQAEVLSLVGDVALGPDGGPQLHAHVVLGKRDGTALGGHLMDARVRPTLEIVLVETPHELRRETDPDTGLALISLGRGQ